MQVAVTLVACIVTNGKCLGYCTSHTSVWLVACAEELGLILVVNVTGYMIIAMMTLEHIVIV
jgi:hypothetical protein